MLYSKTSFPLSHILLLCGNSFTSSRHKIKHTVQVFYGPIENDHKKGVVWRQEWKKKKKNKKRTISNWRTWHYIFHHRRGCWKNFRGVINSSHLPDALGWECNRTATTHTYSNWRNTLSPMHTHIRITLLSNLRQWDFSQPWPNCKKLRLLHSYLP